MQNSWWGVFMPVCGLGQSKCCCPLKQELKSNVPCSRLGEGPAFFLFLPTVYSVSTYYIFLQRPTVI